jgi:peptide/nickel transport system ATP-binding protein
MNTSKSRLHNQPGQTPVLRIEDLSVEFSGARGIARVVDSINIEVGPGEIVGLIGESGSGKTMTALSVLGLLPKQAKVATGKISLGGEVLTGKSEREMRRIRGDRVALVPQDALRALNPVRRVGSQVGEPFELHRGLGRNEARIKAIASMESVHLPQPEERANEYPHQFSGGMQQRAMIAMGLALEPQLLIADEPTTALDVTVQARVLSLLREIRDHQGTSILFITHDLGIIAELCDWVYVIYAGAILEQAEVKQLFADPRHPYTKALLRATPTARTVQEDLLSIPGQIPSPFQLPEGCRFADRCEHRFKQCDLAPLLVETDDGHSTRCWLFEESNG